MADLTILRRDVVMTRKYGTTPLRYIDITGALTGVMFLSDNGFVGFLRPDGLEWSVPLAEVKDVGNARSFGSVYGLVGTSGAMLRATFGDARRTILFTGLEPEREQLNAFDKIVGHLPTHHTFGLGKIYVAAKLEYMQRGKSDRAREACDWWRRLLNGEIQLDEVTKAAEQQLGETAVSRGQPIRSRAMSETVTPISKGELNNAKLVEVFEQAYIDARVDSDGDACVEIDGIKMFLRVDPDRSVMQVWSGLNVKPETTRQQVLELSNRINDGLIFIRASCPASRVMVYLDHYVDTNAGITGKALIGEVRRFRSVISSIPPLDTDGVLA